MTNKEYQDWRKKQMQTLKAEAEEHAKAFSEKQYKKYQQAALKLSNEELFLEPEDYQKITISLHEYLTLQAHIYGAYLGLSHDTVECECDCQA